MDVERNDFSIGCCENDRKKSGCDDACHDPSRNPISWPPPADAARNGAHSHEARQEKYQSKKDRSEREDCEPCKRCTQPTAHCGLVAAEIRVARRAYQHSQGEQHPKGRAREKDRPNIADGFRPLLLGEPIATRRVHGQVLLQGPSAGNPWSDTIGECPSWVAFAAMLVSRPVYPDELTTYCTARSRQRRPKPDEKGR